VVEVGIHFIWEAADGRTFDVSPSDGFLHHYRVCEFDEINCMHHESTVDQTLLAYQYDLISAVKEEMVKIPKIC
jgi:hypothetical protein